MSISAEPSRTGDPLWIFRLGAGSPEQVLEECWPYLHMTPQERDRETACVCRVAMEQWNALPTEVRERAQRQEELEKERGMEILETWAREYRERAERTA